MTLINAHYYSILFYHSDIWLLPSLSETPKTNPSECLSGPTKMCCTIYHPLMLYDCFHNISNRPAPSDFTKYNHALLLHEIYNHQNQTADWLDLNFNQKSTSDATKQILLIQVKTNQVKILFQTDFR